jgi:IS5 family transposase
MSAKASRADRGRMFGWGNLARVGWGMKQLTLATEEFERYAKATRRAAFLDEMDRVVLWSALCALIEPVYPKPGIGRPPVGLERMQRMLRIYLLWYSVPLTQCFRQFFRVGKRRLGFRCSLDAVRPLSAREHHPYYLQDNLGL